MIVKLPTIKKEYIDEKIVRERSFIEVEINTSFTAHLKWEEQFQDRLKCDLTTYTERVRSIIKDENQAKAEFLSMLKLLYCYIDGKDIPTFRDFCELFDIEVAGEILKKIGVILEEVGRTVSKNF